MPQPQLAPYGTWTSPLTSDRIVSATVGLSGVQVDGDDIYWLESRPVEGGRVVLVRRAANGAIADVTPAPFNVRTRAIEVVRSTVGTTNAANAALFWNETGSWGTVYLGPFQTNVKFRFGTGQDSNLPSFTRPASIGSAFSISVATKDGTTESLHVDGVLELLDQGNLSTIAFSQSTGNLGRGYNNNTYFPGRIAEVLVYDRALSDAERQGVEAYLNARYFPGR